MPSQLHEALVFLFRNRPALAPELLRDALEVQLPDYTEVSIRSENLTDIQPAEYRADLVVLLLHGKPVLGIVLEVQLRADPRKRFAWPAYAVGLRSRIHCPVCLLVVTHDDAVARWCAKPIELGGGNRFTPLVLGPSGVPVVTSAERAKADPELAVLSVMAHGRDAPETSAQVGAAALAASAGLDAERAQLYVDLVLVSLSHAARKALQAMDPAKYQYQSDFAKHYFAKGKAEGEAKGKAEGEAKGKAEGEAKGKAEGEAKGKAEGEAKGRVEIVLKLLTLKFGPLSASARRRVARADAAEVERIAERVLRATTLRELFATKTRAAKTKKAR